MLTISSDIYWNVALFHFTVLHWMWQIDLLPFSSDFIKCNNFTRNYAHNHSLIFNSRLNINPYHIFTFTLWTQNSISFFFSFKSWCSFFFLLLLCCVNKCGIHSIYFFLFLYFNLIKRHLIQSNENKIKTTTVCNFMQTWIMRSDLNVKDLSDNNVNNTLYVHTTIKKKYCDGNTTAKTIDSWWKWQTQLICTEWETEESTQLTTSISISSDGSSRH